MQKKELIIFDFDGVLFDSIKNMEKSWEYVRKKYFLSQTFEDYKSYLGYSFENIMIKLGIEMNHKEIKKSYKEASFNNLDLIIPFEGTINTLEELIKKNIKIAICTSKDIERTTKILKKYNLKFDAVEADYEKNKSHKPSPNQINSILNNLNVKKENSVYIGDMLVDYLTAKNANIDYIHANWGYSKIDVDVKLINNIKDIINII